MLNYIRINGLQLQLVEDVNFRTTKLEDKEIFKSGTNNFFPLSFSRTLKNFSLLSLCSKVIFVVLNSSTIIMDDIKRNTENQRE